MVRKNKRRRRDRITQALESEDPRDGPKVIKSILYPRFSSTAPTVSGDLDLAAFNKYVATSPGKGYVPPIVPFEMSLDLQRKVYRAILKAKRNRASGTDELFSEAFKISPKEFARILSLF